MRTSKLRTVLALSLLVAVSTQSVYAARFIDLSNNWAQKAVNSLSDKGVIAAEPDGKFKPNDPVTRAIFACWLAKTLGIDKQPFPPTASFPDVKPTDWYFKYVEIIRQNNYISGYADGFRPNQYIQKGEVISIISRTLTTSPPDDMSIAAALSKFADGSKVPDWARKGVAQATLVDIVANNPNPNNIEAAKIATRADTAALLDKLSQYLTRQAIAEGSQPKPGPSATSPPIASAPPSAAPPYGQPPYQPPTYQGSVTEQGRAAPPQYQPPPQQAYQPPPQQYQPPPQQAYQPPPQQYQPPPQHAYQPPQQYSPPGSFVGSTEAYPPLQGQTPQSAAYPQGGALQGRVAVVAAGTRFQASLKNTLDSGSTQPGEPVEATLSAPIYSGGVEVVPAGSKITGQVTNVVSARRFRFGANGKIDVRFTAVETPDGRKFPLSASVDDNAQRMTGGTTAGRVGKGVVTAGVGAASGAALGTALGAIVGATSRGQVGRATGMGAVFGTAIGGGIGVVGAGVRKGSEVKITAGTPLPIQLDESMQVTTGGPPPFGQGQPYYGGGSYPPPQQPPGGNYYSQ